MRKLVSFLAVAAGVSLIAAQSKASDLSPASPTNGLSNVLATNNTSATMPNLVSILASSKAQPLQVNPEGVLTTVPQKPYTLSVKVGNQTYNYVHNPSASPYIYTPVQPSDHRTYQNIPECWIVDTLKVNANGTPSEIIGHNQYGEHKFSVPKLMGVAPSTVTVTPAK